MAVDESLAGRTFPPTDPYLVTEERIAEFAAATGGSWEGGPAPATFPIVVAFAAMTGLMEDPSVGISLHNVIHGEQRFTYHRPVVAGDRLSAPAGQTSGRWQVMGCILRAKKEANQARLSDDERAQQTVQELHGVIVSQGVPECKSISLLSRSRLTCIQAPWYLK